MADTDQTLVAAARDGDRAALEKLLERHQSAVYRFGMKMCGEAEDAKDVLQETLFAAARTLPDFRGASSVSDLALHDRPQLLPEEAAHLQVRAGADRVARGAAGGFGPGGGRAARTRRRTRSRGS